MPELPEVETVRRGLEKLILGKKISSIEIRYPKMIKTDLDLFMRRYVSLVLWNSCLLTFWTPTLFLKN